ncbi:MULTISPECIES: hypothetical protein [Sphingomonas]|uniref:hypothetical protein n=1 Tax=Sphingomonas TaxID=13687 RepID=UPI001AE4335C
MIAKPPVKTLRRDQCPAIGTSMGIAALLEACISRTVTVRGLPQSTPRPYRTGRSCSISWSRRLVRFADLNPPQIDRREAVTDAGGRAPIDFLKFASKVRDWATALLETRRQAHDFGAVTNVFRSRVAVYPLRSKPRGFEGLYDNPNPEVCRRGAPIH